MEDKSILFGRELLRAVHADVRERFPEIRLKDAWVYHYGKDKWEFHYRDFYWYGRSGNAYEARFRGWQAWLDKQAQY